MSRPKGAADEWAALGGHAAQPRRRVPVAGSVARCRGIRGGVEPLRLRDEVAERTGVNAETAAFALTSVLGALGLELSPTDDERLRRQLPEPWGDVLQPDPGANFRWGEFIRRVAQPDGPPHRPREVAEAVIEVLRSHVDDDAARALLRVPASFPTDERVAATLARMRGGPPGGSAGDEEIALAVARVGRGEWRHGSEPGDWVIEDEDRGRGQLHWADAELEARVWRRNTGPTPAPELELTNGPTVFRDAEDAVEYVEANLLGVDD